MKTNIMLGLISLFLVFSIISSSVKAENPTDWNYRMQVQITARESGFEYNNYTMNVSIDPSALITAGKLRPDLYDIRMSNDAFQFIPMTIIRPRTGNVTIWFNASLPGGSGTYYIYYDNPTASTPPQYDLDDFDVDGSTMDLTTVGNPSDVFPEGTITQADRYSGTIGGTQNSSISWDAEVINHAFSSPLVNGSAEFYFNATNNGNAIIFLLDDATTTEKGPAIAVIGGNLQYYHSGGSTVIEALQTGQKYWISIKWNTATDKYDLVVVRGANRWSYVDISPTANTNAISRIYKVKQVTYFDDLVVRNTSGVKSDPSYSWGSEEEVTNPPVLTITSPTDGATYWSILLNAQWSALSYNDAVFNTSLRIDDVIIYDDSSYANTSTATLNMTNLIQDPGNHIISYMSNDSKGNIVTNYTITIALNQFSDYNYNRWENETKNNRFNVSLRFNPELVKSVDDSFIWNNTNQGAGSVISINGSYSFITKNYTIGLLANNNTNVTWRYQASLLLHNGTTIDVNSSLNDQNITYSVWISSLLTDASQYLEGEDINIDLNLKRYSTSPTLSTNISIVYNSSYVVNRTMTTYTDSTNQRLYEYVYNALSITSGTYEPREIFTNVTIGFDGRYRSISTNTSVTVYKMQIMDCTSGGDPALTIRFFNETDFLAKKGRIDMLLFTVRSGSVTQSYSFYNLTQNETYTFCVFPTWATMSNSDIYLEYSSANSPERQYYVNNIVLSNVRSYLDAYLLNSTYAYYTNFFVYDQVYAKLPGAFLRILKMNPDTATYETMFIGKTDSEGILATFVEPITQQYIIYIMDYNGTVLYRTDPEVIPCVSGSCPPYEKSIYVSPGVSGYVDFSGLSTSFSYDNATGTVEAEVIDSSGLVQSVRINIWSLGDFGRRTIYYSNEVSSSSIYYTGVLPNTTSEYFMQIDINEYGTWYPAIVESISMERVETLGTMGIILAFILVTVCEIAGIMTFGPIGGILGGGLAIGTCYWLKLIPMTLAGVMSILTIFVIFGYLVMRES